MSTINVFSYNLRMDTPVDGINAFSARKDYVLRTFPKYNADIVGFQEILPHMRQWLIDNFTDYEICGIGRGEHFDNESNVIAYKRDKFDLIQLETFWLSDTPHQPGSRFSTDQSPCPRICTCVTLLHRETGRVLRHYNTHLDHEGQFAQAQGISLVLNRIASDYDTWQAPVILTGDFNATPDSVVVKSVLKFGGCGGKLIDTTASIKGSYHGYNEPDSTCKIDFVFSNLPYDESSVIAARDCENGVYLSDHYPVGVKLEI